ncbi:E3 ubiquitin-protein ligase RNF126-like [Symsagittifera roscoffensis]|uniref:E3 ubiquitin-protein ligase RNF126-like n=1 Tax=Symsagittifera roscoffensis TaxID=84072 RepID=UPI00307C27AF
MSSNSHSTGAEFGGSQSRFFCHQCRAYISPSSDENLVCPDCNGSFIEEVTQENAADFDSGEDPMPHPHMDYQNDIFSLISAFLPGFDASLNSSAENNDDGLAAMDTNSATVNAPDEVDAAGAGQNNPGTSAAQGSEQNDRPHRSNRNSRFPRGPPIHSRVFDSNEDMSSVYNSPTSVPNGVQFNNESIQRLIDGLMFHQPFNVVTVNGNPQDYAWGPGGLDTILTQMMEQLEGGGPPPLSASVIAAIPSVEISAEHVKSESDCSVCQEKFTLKEKVLSLPCAHLFHKECIEPWLKLHNACPVCRKPLDDPNSPQAPGAGTSASANRATAPNYEDLDDPDPAIFRNSNMYG